MVLPLIIPAIQPMNKPVDIANICLFSKNAILKFFKATANLVFFCHSYGNIFLIQFQPDILKNRENHYLYTGMILSHLPHKVVALYIEESNPMPDKRGIHEL